MPRVLLSLGLVAALALPAAAQEVYTGYAATIGPADRVNSRGVPLGDVCAFVQQDRANVHRFGIRDPYDQVDGVFGSQEMRTRIPSLCRVVDGTGEIAAAVRRGGPFPLYVQVMGAGHRIVEVVVYYGAG